jgi:hypothetical protein
MPPFLGGSPEIVWLTAARTRDASGPSSARRASAARPPPAEAEGIFKLCFDDNAPQSLVDFFGSHQPDR